MKPSLRITISTVFTALFLVTILTILFTSYSSNERSILGVAEDLLDGNAQVVTRKTQDYLRPAASVAALNAALAKRSISEVDDVTWFQRLCVEFVRAHPQLREVNVGNEAGTMYGAERREGGVVNRYIITQQEGRPALVDYRFFDANDLPVGARKVEREYDPRTRPWYRGAVQARGTFWTEPYVFITDKMQVGITAAFPLYDGDGGLRGVMSCDMEMAEISDFLKRQVVGRTGYSFIINGRSKVVAHPEMAKIVKRTGERKVEMVSLEEMGPPWLAAAYARHRAQGVDTLTVEATDEGNERMIVAFRTLPRDAADPWKIVLVAPEDDFIAGLKENNRWTLLLTLGILVVSIFLIGSLAHGISRRLKLLTSETERLQRFDLDGDIRVTSRIAEIERIAGAVSRLQSAMRAFKKYVPAQLVRSLMETGEEVRLGGENRNLTIFFSDIRDFTSLSEEMDPKFLMTHLSEYLEELTAIILASGGTIDKYIGDGIMAFWGAPVPQEDHALRCCRAAVGCVMKLRELNERWRAEGKPELHTRIGIHTGETTVGNMGSSERMNYTLLGDSVNLASRLEGVNKTYGTSILISEATYSLVEEHFVTRPIDFVVVKGKRETVKVYEILDETGTADPAQPYLAGKFTEAFDLFHGHQWGLAEEALQALQEEFPDDAATGALLARCTECQELPSRKTWWRKRMDQK